MKKYIKYVLILLVGVLLLPISVHAEGNLVVNMYEKEKWDDFSELEYNAFEYLQYVKGYFHWTIDYGEEDTYYLYDEDENLVFSYVYDYNEDSPFQINHDYYILENNIEYIFTDDDSLDPTLEDYDGIELIFEKDRDNEIYLSKIKEETRTPGTIINGKPKINKLNIDVDVKFSDVTDYILYKTIIKNNTETDYVIDNTTKFGDSEYIKYDFEFENDNNVILAGEEKVMYVRITYNKEIPATILASGNYTETRALQVELMTEVGDTTNPPTGDNIINILIMLGASIILLIVMIKYKKARTIMIFVISGLILIPTIATAEEKINITINAKIEVAGMKKFCYRTYETDMDSGEETSIDTYYDYKDGMTWEKYYNSDIKENIEQPNKLQYFTYEECSTDRSRNQKMRSSSIDEPIDCNGVQEVYYDSAIKESSIGCYYIETESNEK